MKYQNILKIKDIIKETEDTNTFVIEETIDYMPGQYLNLKFCINDKNYVRSYSLSSTPNIDPYPAITVKRVKNGIISNHMIDQLDIGHQIHTELPKGKFIIESNQNYENFIFIGAGSGITPLISMIKYALYFCPKIEVTLIYCNRNQDSIIFNQHINDLYNKFPDRFYCFHILSQPFDGWEGFKNRLNPTAFTEIINSRPNYYLSPNTHYYLCGPVQMMEMIINTLQNFHNIPLTNIHWESFSNNLDITQKDILCETKHNSKISDVIINYEDQKYNIKVKQNQTILEAALDEDIDLPFACSNGTCNVCQAKCIKGKVKMDIDDGLTEEEIADNYILTCVSRPETDEIEIDIE